MANNPKHRRNRLTPDMSPKNPRIAKKWAKRFLDGTMGVRTFKDRVVYTTDGDYADIAVADLGPRMMRTVLRIARKDYDWDGCWYTNPLYLAMTFGKDNYDE